MLLPFEVADYVDFYASEHHASNVGRMFRPDGEPLTPNWRHLPIAYHGRAGTVVVSGTDVVRPSGQRKAPTDAGAGRSGPAASSTSRWSWVSSSASAPSSGCRSRGGLRSHVFGVVHLERLVGAGPAGLGVRATRAVPREELRDLDLGLGGAAGRVGRASAPRRAGPRRALLDYLHDPGGGYDIDIEVLLNGERLSTCPYASMYYSPAQMLAHLTINGACLRTGDLFGSGTISGPAPDQQGSLLELSWNGTRPLRLAGGERTFLLDGDEVIMRGSARTATGGCVWARCAAGSSRRLAR